MGIASMVVVSGVAGCGGSCDSDHADSIKKDIMAGWQTDQPKFPVNTAPCALPANAAIKVLATTADWGALTTELGTVLVTGDYKFDQTPVDGEPADVSRLAELGREWEWEQTPEVTLLIVDSVADAVRLCNRYSPHFVASLLSQDEAEHAQFFADVDAPLIGDGFTRWVDGQVALKKPELGLSNWQFGRLFGRGGILSGDTVYTVRTRYVTRR